MDVAASSRHVWAGRFNLYVELEPSPSFYCAWWIARLAIVRMIGLTADARLAESGPSPSRLPALWLRGAQRSGLLEISVCAERLQPEADAAAAQSAPTDSLLLAYASVLCGEIPASGAGVRGNGLTLRFPVSSEPLPQICVVA